MPEMPESDTSRVGAENSEWVMQSLEAGQLSSAKAKHYPRRPLKPKRGHSLLGTADLSAIYDGRGFYQVWTTAH